MAELAFESSMHGLGHHVPGPFSPAPLFTDGETEAWIGVVTFQGFSGPVAELVLSPQCSPASETPVAGEVQGPWECRRPVCSQPLPHPSSG